jgi:hypothetical protein
MMGKKVGGFVMKGCLNLSGVKSSGSLPREVIELDSEVKGILKFEHDREPVKGSVNMTFVMHKTFTLFGEFEDVVRRLGHQPAVVSEVESIRALSKEKVQTIFKMAKDHAVKRNPAGSYVNTFCLPVFASRVFVNKKKYVPVLLLNEEAGFYTYQLYPVSDTNRVHPMWIVPVVPLS